MANPSFNGSRVLVLESRRARELGLIVTSYGGEPLVAPSMREVPIESNVDAVRFIDDLIAGGFDVVVFLTGVGARALLDIVQRVQGTRKRLVDALKESVVRVHVRATQDLDPALTLPGQLHGSVTGRTAVFTVSVRSVAKRKR